VQENLSEMLQPLHAAACVGAEEVCLSLLNAGAKVPDLSCVLCFQFVFSLSLWSTAGSVQVGVVNLAGLSPLHLACQFGHCGCVRVLLAAGALVDSFTSQQEYVVCIVC